MKRLTPLILLLSSLFLIIARADSKNRSQILSDYLNAPEKNYSWSEIEPENEIQVLEIDSLKWQNHLWKHTLTIIEPADDLFPDTALLIINIKGNPKNNHLLTTLANGSGIKVLALSNIPNQPIFDRKEDALIAHTFQKFLETGDTTWPLLLPMTKAVTQAMNAVQEFTKENGKPIKKFIVGGASKRGWTTWLAGSQDKRITGIIPIVYDNLDLPAQMRHQRKMLGQYSEKISDYTDLNLPDLIDSPEGKALVEIVDPYAYRNQIKIPKLIINGTNDPYWTVDSLNLYYDDLKGPKNVLYIPNAGHGLSIDKRENFTNALSLLGTLQNWIRLIASGQKPPKIRLKTFEKETGKLFQVRAEEAASAQLWFARSASKNFHDARWRSEPMEKIENLFKLEIETPAEGFIAVFAQVEWKTSPNPLPMYLSTPITLWEK